MAVEEMVLARCFYCKKPVDPDSRTVAQRSQGWEIKAGVRESGKHGGSDIYCRETVQEFCCTVCLGKLRRGINPMQDDLL